VTDLPSVQLCLRLDEDGGEPLVVCLIEESVIGRDFRSDVVVHDREASRMHARVSPDIAGSWIIVDLATTNGTFVNSERIVGPATLRFGDVIRIGRATCTLVESPT
jgi:hypothetical protein